MDEFSLKTRLFNKARLLGRIPAIENIIVRLTQNKATANFAAKLAPNNYQYPHNTLRKCERNGIKYSLDISDYMQYCIYYGIEIEPREKLYGLVRNGTTVIDVGVNIGETLLNFAKRNSDGLSIGFEPVPYLFELANENIRLNGLPNVILDNVALSDREGELHFNIANEFNSGGIFLSSQPENDSSGRVSAIKFDDYVSQKGLDNISLIKIDVEGFEMNVLNGAKETIHKFKPALFVEINDSFLCRQQSSANEVVKCILAYGYQVSHAETGEIIHPDYQFAGKHFDIICIPNHID